MPRQCNISWRKNLKPGQNLFTKNFKSDLRLKFQISTSGIQFLSDRLTTVIVRNRPLGFSVLPVVYEPEEGLRSIVSALDQLSSTKDSLLRAIDLIDPVRFNDDKGSPRVDMQRMIEARIAETQKQLDLLKIALIWCVKSDRVMPILPGSIGRNKRSSGLQPHEKRKLFFEICFECLAREGRHLGYTTNSNNTRGGETIRFVQTVLSELTEKGSSIPESTIRGDLRRWKPMHQRAQEVLRNIE